jgi:hypothetical protein
VRPPAWHGGEAAEAEADVLERLRDGLPVLELLAELGEFWPTLDCEEEGRRGFTFREQLSD